MFGAEVPEPEAVYCTNWYKNPLSLGSFHSICIGMTPADIENLSCGLRNLHFAGSIAVFDSKQYNKVLYVGIITYCRHHLYAVLYITHVFGIVHNRI